MSEYVLRPIEPGDLRFVLKTWLDSYRSSKSAGFLLNDPLVRKCECGRDIHYDYASVMSATIERLLHQPDVHAIVACDPYAMPPNDLFGYIVYERNPQVPVYRAPRYQLEREFSSSPLVHYVFIKKTFRRFGIARALFGAAGIDPLAHFLHTCTTPLAVEIQRANKIPLAEWNPGCARFEKETGQVHDQASRQAPSHRTRTSAAPTEQLRRRHEQR